MYNYFYLLFALQAFCVYHAYKNRQDQKWYWMIIFFPLVGCLIYIYDAFYTRRTVETIAEGLKQVVSSNYNIERLEKEVNFNNSTKNKIDLGDAYIASGRVKEAIALYEECRMGYMADDIPLTIKVMHAYFLDAQFDRCIQLGESLMADKSFRDSDERISLALSYNHVGRTEEAIRQFEEMDRPFTNYEHRYAYAHFLASRGKISLAKEKIKDMLVETDAMKSIERKTHREAIGKIRELQRSFG